MSATTTRNYLLFKTSHAINKKNEEIIVFISSGLNGGLRVSNKNEIGAFQKGSGRPPGEAARVGRRSKNITAPQSSGEPDTVQLQC